ncbi:hypothetical protein BC826DRAFT_658178 [Russula brevipes]|nr:hypothetical protein BC826DRAFT_658178 [Russula brevipes]
MRLVNHVDTEAHVKGNQGGRWRMPTQSTSSCLMAETGKWCHTIITACPGPYKQPLSEVQQTQDEMRSPHEVGRDANSGAIRLRTLVHGVRHYCTYSIRWLESGDLTLVRVYRALIDRAISHTYSTIHCIALNALLFLFSLLFLFFDSCIETHSTHCLS